MAHYDLILKNGTVTTFSHATESMITAATDIAVSQGVITNLAPSSSDTAQTILDLRGLNIIPGVIDSQVHFRDPGLTHKEDIASGTLAAILGGVTSIFEMPNTVPSTTTEEAYQQKMLTALKSAHCHYAFYIGGSAENIEQISKLEQLSSCPGIKIFLGSSFGSLLIDSDQVFESILAHGHRRVIIHSEDEKRLRERKTLATESNDVKMHPVWRDEKSAMISTEKSIHLARKYQRSVHILHVSSAEEMAFLKQNKDIASVEILPQFLTLAAPDCYERFGTLAQQNPPIRDQRHLKYLWQAVTDGTVDVIGSDHAPHTLEEKNQIYPKSPSGMPGVQTLLPIMLNHVHEDRLSFEKLVQLITENPRRLFGVQNKGRIQVGFDADFTIVDLKHRKTIEQSWLASKSNWSPFVGMSVMGWPKMTILKGQVVMSHDEVLIQNSGRPVIFKS